MIKEKYLPTVKDYIRLADQGWILRAGYWNVHNNLMGLCKYDLFEMDVYLMNIQNERDFKTTIAHETIHALKPKYREGLVERLGNETYRRKPWVIDFALDLWDIPDYFKLEQIIKR